MKKTKSTPRAMPRRFAVSTGSVRLIPPPKFNPREGMRLVKRVESGWPQALFVLTCNHSILVPTWHNGECTPKPRQKWYRCEKCDKTRGFSKRFHEWYQKHGETWYAKHPSSPNAAGQPRDTTL